MVLTPETSAAPGMVFVPGGAFEYGNAPAVRLPQFWMDQFEVTNAQYKQFVDAGGYRDPKYWKEPFRDGARLLTFDEAMVRLRDSTGRAGPASWEVGGYPDGQADFPVGGLSWFEARAFANFAEKELPSLYHWFFAAGVEELYSDVLRMSNFDGKGPVKVGERNGLGPWGTFDMAGNVKEWVSNVFGDTGKRYILGGGFDEPNYRFVEQDAQNPWTRFSSYGLRLVKNLGPASHTTVAVGSVTPDPATVIPVNDEVFETLKGFYSYDRTALNARVDAVDDTSPHWKKETISFDAAYGKERVRAYLFLPKNATAPFQTIVLFPNAFARQSPSSTHLDLGSFEFVVRSGRALLYPV